MLFFINGKISKGSATRTPTSYHPGRQSPQDVFFEDSDGEYYLELLREWCRQEGIEILAYCLMTNHVYLIVMPGLKSELGKAIGEVHRRYTRMVTTESTAKVIFGKIDLLHTRWMNAGY